MIIFSDNDITLKAKRISLEMGEWQLIKLGDKSISEPILFFSVTEDKIAGTTGCNTFNGLVNQKGYSVSFNDISATEMDCEGFDTISEVVFLRALEKVTRFTQIGSVATFYSGNVELFILENTEQL